jgi:muconolactone delta-isomerase
MRYLVEIAIKQPPTQEILALIPKETAHGKQFDTSGVRDALYVSAEGLKAWQVYNAESKAEVETIVGSFPLTPFCSVMISELRE